MMGFAGGMQDMFAKPNSFTAGIGDVENALIQQGVPLQSQALGVSGADQLYNSAMGNPPPTEQDEMQMVGQGPDANAILQTIMQGQGSQGGGSGSIAAGIAKMFMGMG